MDRADVDPNAEAEDTFTGKLKGFITIDGFGDLDGNLKSSISPLVSAQSTNGTLTVVMKKSRGPIREGHRVACKSKVIASAFGNVIGRNQKSTDDP
nr:hypothetical protein Ade03nite_94420 [Actinoplanes derwentensis]